LLRLKTALSPAPGTVGLELQFEPTLNVPPAVLVQLSVAAKAPSGEQTAAAKRQARRCWRQRG
jgi:hypothetical protein